ncbi:unknown [Cryptophlebia leucotreta granulovirus]|uniref:Uncharacterized protein n=1 Tax=Cryptophlebia leucotreta granulosis virus TaxID=35254 RepID=Q7T5P8_GVCL|nr:hypothetical protein [Cryptophlebia leucotreta granulovirus]AAQ21636.1 unknown [Cryptophlebia leucotreta granulovirus]
MAVPPIHIIDNIFWTFEFNTPISSNDIMLKVENSNNLLLYQTNKLMILKTNALNLLKDIHRMYIFIRENLYTNAIIVCGNTSLTLPTLVYFLRAHHGMDADAAVKYMESKTQDIMVPYTEYAPVVNRVHTFLSTFRKCYKFRRKCRQIRLAAIYHR